MGAKSTSRLTLLPTQGSTVPCNGCTICCKKELIPLQPDNGDNPDDYLCRLAVDPISGRIVLALDHKENGDCIYLNETGCSIHGRAPVVCREFDCRKFYLSLGDRATRRRMMRRGQMDRDLMEAGRSRLSSLTAEEVAEVKSWGPSRMAQILDARS